MIDIHAHILPEIDDGAADWATSLEMCRMAAADGVSAIVATPHMLDGVYNVSRATVLTKVEELRQRLSDAGVAITVLPGADIHVESDFLALLKAGQLVTINDAGKYVLVEFSHYTLPPRSSEFLFSIRTTGTIPIITHPERNFDIQRRPDIVAEWVGTGNLVQVTAASITGHFGSAARELAESLLRANLVHVVASDAHSVKERSPILSAARAAVTTAVSAEVAERLFMTNPEHIVKGEEFELPEHDPIVRKRRRFWFFR